MYTEMKKLVELTRLRGEKLNPEFSSEQINYYNEMADWIESQNFQTAMEVTEATKKSKFYLGGGEAKELDGINLRIKAMKEIHYDDVIAIHYERKEKLQKRGFLDYPFSQEWIDDYRRVQDEINKYAKRKEVFGRIFSAYFNLKGNPQEKHRKEAFDNIKNGLLELQNLGTSFDELVKDRVYRDLTMATEKGIENFIEFVNDVSNQNDVPEISMGYIKEEQERIEKWAKENEKELIEIGKKEQWHTANCIAVPSNDPLGYDFISMKEVK
ncbi:MAG: hypothetical protein RR495_05350 [Anaerovoracaceae bacterium]